MTDNKKLSYKTNNNCNKKLLLHVREQKYKTNSKNDMYLHWNKNYNNNHNFYVAFLCVYEGFFIAKNNQAKNYYVARFKQNVQQIIICRLDNGTQ